MKLSGMCFAMALMAGIAAAQPSISSVVNAASGIVQALPNGGIAQGAIFTLIGKNMGPATLSVDPTPFTNARLLGTSVSVTVKGTTVDALMYYTSATQVSGLLPSNTPVGAGTVTVTYNGAASPPAPITVVASNAGIFTTPPQSVGYGAAVVTFPDYSVVSAFPGNPCGGPNTTCGAANPKDVLILWLTGLGPVSAPDNSGPQPGNMSGLPLKLWIGGVQADVSYQGRSGCCIGVDQVVFTVPDNAPAGCAVPLFIQIDTQVSNNTFIPIANGDRTCTPVNPSFTPAVASALAVGGAVTSTQVKLRRRPNNNGQLMDRADAQFQKSSVLPGMLPFALSILDFNPLGTCFMVNDPNVDITPAVLAFQGGIDAGPSLNLNGPNGAKTLSKTVTAGQPTDYFVNIGPGYFSPGSYTVTNGTGGADVGSFTANLTIPALPSWTNQASLATVTRANGLTVTWSGGSSQYVNITGGSFTDTSLTTGAVFSCLVSGDAGTFTVPASVLLALPAVPATPNGVLTFQASAAPNTFTASGLTLGEIDYNANTSIQVTYK